MNYMFMNCIITKYIPIITLLFSLSLYAEDLRQRDSLALVALMQINSDSVDFDWKFRQKLEKWKGVTIRNNRVTELNLRDCKVDTLPAEIGHLTALEVLNLSNPISRRRLSSGYASFIDLNLLTELPEEIGELKSLRKLNLEGNHIQVLPEGFYNLTNLEELNLRFNGPWNPFIGYDDVPKDLHLFTEEVKKLKKLKVLDLSRGNIKRLPINLKHIKSLEILKLISTDVGGISFQDTLPELRELHLRRTSIRYLSPLDRFPKLELLDLSVAYHDTLPKDLGKLKQLKKLNLSYNYGIDLRELLAIKDNLEELDLTACRLYKRMPSEKAIVFSLTSLKRLDISYNGLDSIPKEIENLNTLTHLISRGNGLTTLPEELAKLPALEYLDVGNNRLDTLPTVIGMLKACKYLHVGRNRVRFYDIPKAVRKMDMDVKRNDISFNYGGYTFPPFLGWSGGENKSLLYGIRGGPLFHNYIDTYVQTLSPQIGYYGQINKESNRQLLYVGGSYTPSDPDLYVAMGVAVSGGYIRGWENGAPIKGGRASISSYIVPFIPCGIEFAFSNINRKKQLEIQLFFGLTYTG